VTVGTTSGNRVVINSGVAPGDTIVIDGFMVLFPGAKVRAVEGAKNESGTM